MTVQFAGADYIVIVWEANVLGCETGALVPLLAEKVREMTETDIIWGICSRSGVF